MINLVKFVGIPVTDQNRALEFYTKMLGFTVHTDQPMGPGQRWLELAVPGSETGVALFTPPGHEARIGTFQNLAFGAKDVKATYEELRGRGVEFTQPLKEQEWGTSFTFKDPDGNQFVVSNAA